MSHTHRLLLILLLCLSAGPGHATFELEDPAAEAMKLLDEDDEAGKTSPAANAGATACSDYVKGRKKGSDSYWASLTWLLEFMDISLNPGSTAAAGDSGAEYDPDTMARWIEDYCIERPEDKLLNAAEAFVQSGVPG